MFSTIFAFLMAHILYIDTSGQFSKILIFSSEKLLAARHTTESNQHAQSINTHIKELLEETKLSWQSISAIAVMNGPGSYTGLRIGLASAKGFCFAHDIPLILISHFDLMNYCCANNENKNAFILKARENEFFYRQYNSTSEKPEDVLIIDTEELKFKSASLAISLQTTDESLLTVSEQVRHMMINDKDIHAFVITQFNHKHFADVMNSEPFYLKNVHINKINKL